MKKTNILYWTFTSLFVFFMAGGAIPDLLSNEIAVNGFKSISMPPYLTPFLGAAKILGAIAILIPGYPRIKEWAYAGLIFDLLGATWCIYSSGVRGGNLYFMAIPLATAFLSYVYYHKRLAGKQAQVSGIPANVAFQ